MLEYLYYIKYINNNIYINIYIYTNIYRYRTITGQSQIKVLIFNKLSTKLEIKLIQFCSILVQNRFNSLRIWGYFGIYGLTVQGLKICILALLAPNNLNLWGFYALRFLKKYIIPSIWHFKGYFRHFNHKNK